MSHPIDVGSVLGGRYKVTATVLTSHDEDLVLDGRGPGAEPSREHPRCRPGKRRPGGPERPRGGHRRTPRTGADPDLGVSDDATYLITNHTSAADLLDLVVSSNPPYVENRSSPTRWAVRSSARPGRTSPKPMTASTTTRKSTPATSTTATSSSGQPPSRWFRRGRPPPRRQQRRRRSTGEPERPPPQVLPGSRRRGAAKAAKPSNARRPRRQDAAPQPTVANPVQPEQSAKSAPTSSNPKVSLVAGRRLRRRRPGTSARSHGTSLRPRSRLAPPQPARLCPQTRRGRPGDYDDDDDDAPRREPRSMRWLVGALLAAVLVIGLIFAVTNLGGLFKGGTPQAAKTTSTSTGTPEQSGTPSTSQSAPPAAVPPAIESVSRQGNFDFAAPTTATWSRRTTATPPATGPTWNSPPTPGAASLRTASRWWSSSRARPRSPPSRSASSVPPAATSASTRRPALARRRQAGGQQQLHLAGVDAAVAGTGDRPVRHHPDQEPAEAGRPEDPLRLRPAARGDQGPVAVPGVPAAPHRYPRRTGLGPVQRRTRNIHPVRLVVPCGRPSWRVHRQRKRFTVQ